MIHLTLHQTTADFDSQKDNFVKPHVAYVVETKSVDYEPKIDYSKKYLTFVATQSGTFKLSGNSINYSLDDGKTWTALESNTDSPTVNAGDKILWKATLTPTSSIGIGTFSSTANFIVEGNPMSLLYGDNFSGQTSLSGKDYAFYRLFSGNTNVTSAENLSLPATTLASHCYDAMFQGCTSLTTAPQLLATTLASDCYHYMFYGCTSLTTAPELLATTLAERCYQCMFYGCTSLTTAPQLLAITLAKSCYSSMFYGCTSLTTAPSVLPATTLADSCYYRMFSGCTSLTTAPTTLPATTLAKSCYCEMFSYCRSLTTAPTLPATTLTSYCYNGMFYRCSRLNSITCLATNISASWCITGWVGGVAASGTFTKAANMSSWTTGNDGIPSGWSVQDAS